VDVQLFYYAGVLTGRITGLARPSVGPSVCLYMSVSYGLPTQKRNYMEKPELARKKPVCQFSAQRLVGQPGDMSAHVSSLLAFTLHCYNVRN